MGNSDGPPMLLIHGYTDNSRSWSLLAPYLKAHRLLAIDLRGHGKSDAPQCCYGYADLANDAALFLDAMGIAKADVIGHSLGSLTAQLLAAQHPEKVDRLVLISSTTGFGGGPGSWLWDNIMPLTPPIDPNGQFMKDWYTNPNPVDEDFITRERAESAAVPIHVWHGVLWATVIDDLTLVAPLVKAPVLVLWGEKDQLLRPDAPGEAGKGLSRRRVPDLQGRRPQHVLGIPGQGRQGDQRLPRRAGQSLTQSRGSPKSSDRKSACLPGAKQHRYRNRTLVTRRRSTGSHPVSGTGRRSDWRGSSKCRPGIQSPAKCHPSAISPSP